MDLCLPEVRVIQALGSLLNHYSARSLAQLEIVHLHLRRVSATMSNSYTPGVRHIFDYLNVIRREEPAYDESFDSGDLSRYTEAKFFDFDMGQPGEEMVAKKDVRVVEPAIASVDLGMKGGEMEFLGMAATFHSRMSKNAQ